MDEALAAPPAPKAVVGRPFQKGQSGNPGGRPSKKNLRLKLKQLEPKALDALKEALEGPGGAQKLKAVELLLAYRYGKPVQQTELSGMDGEALRVSVNIHLEEESPHAQRAQAE